MDKNEFDTLLQKYLSGTATPEEEQLMEQWYAAIDNDAAPAGEIEKGLAKRRIWKGVKKHTRDHAMPDAVAPHRPSTWPWALGMAAVLCAAIVAYIYMVTPGADSADAWLGEGLDRRIANMGVTDSTVQLADGSHISIQPGSVLQVAAAFGKGKREVYLVRGEAFFEVARDTSKPFYVYTQNVVTRVLGTSFTVNARQPNVVVAVRTGKVTVSSRDNGAEDAASRADVILTPNQQAVYDAEQGTLLRQLIQAPVLLVSEREIDNLHFEGAGLPAILDALAKAYGIAIVYKPGTLASCRLTTSIDKNESLYDRLDIICDAIGASYRVDGVKITIDSPGCK